MLTLGVEEGDPSLESIEDPDFLFRTFLTDVERGGARGAAPSRLWQLILPTLAPLPLREEDCEVRLMEPREHTHTHTHTQSDIIMVTH